MVAKKLYYGYCVIQSWNHQKLKEEKILWCNEIHLTFLHIKYSKVFKLCERKTNTNISKNNSKLAKNGPIFKISNASRIKIKFKSGVNFIKKFGYFNNLQIIFKIVKREGRGGVENLW